MAWFLNQFRCNRCHHVWTDEWSCMCDDDCPECGRRHMPPFGSNDLTELIVPESNGFVVLRSSDEAEHDPDYREAGHFPTRVAAEAFISGRDQST